MYKKDRVKSFRVKSLDRAIKRRKKGIFEEDNGILGEISKSLHDDSVVKRYLFKRYGLKCVDGSHSTTAEM